MHTDNFEVAYTLCLCLVSKPDKFKQACKLPGNKQLREGNGDQRELKVFNFLPCS